jgi:galactokinase
LDNGGTRGHRFKTPIVPAGTQWAILIDSDVSELAGASTRAAIELAIKKNPRTDSHSDVDIDKVVQTFSQAEALFGSRCGADAVLE